MTTPTARTMRNIPDDAPATAFAAMFLSGLVSFFVGVVAMACMAMAGYDGDEQRSEPE